MASGLRLSQIQHLSRIEMMKAIIDHTRITVTILPGITRFRIHSLGTVIHSLSCSLTLSHYLILSLGLIATTSHLSTIIVRTCLGL